MIIGKKNVKVYFWFFAKLWTDISFKNGVYYFISNFYRSIPILNIEATTYFRNSTTPNAKILGVFAFIFITFS